MMATSRWTALPTRREISLLLFAFAVFIISFNLNASLHLVGLRSVASLSKFGLGPDPGLDPDGRRPQAYRDDLENLIVGDWDWEEGQVAGAPLKNTNTSLWFSHGPAAHEEFVKWGDTRPESKLVAHAPGYTVIDSLVMLNGSFYIITNDSSHWPSLNTIGSKGWNLISTVDAAQILLPYAGSIHGVTMLSMDVSEDHDSHTLLSLWRTYSSLDPQIMSTGATILPPPSRICFPHINTFVEPKTEDKSITRTRSYAGFRQELLKTAYPSMGVMYAEDMEDLSVLGVPFVMERAVIADHEASLRGDGSLGWTAPFVTLEASKNWWEPIRRTLSRNLYVDLEMNGLVITYIARQDDPWGPRLRDEDHSILVEALRQLGTELKCTINIISTSTGWDDKMTSILNSTVVFGVYGEQLLDGIFMKPSSLSTLMEFWPSGAFTNDRELPVRATGLKYMAWWQDRAFTSDSLPPVSPPVDTRQFRQTISIDSRAIVQAVRDIIAVS